MSRLIRSPAGEGEAVFTQLIMHVEEIKQLVAMGSAHVTERSLGHRMIEEIGIGWLLSARRLGERKHGTNEVEVTPKLRMSPPCTDVVRGRIHGHESLGLHRKIGFQCGAKPIRRNFHTRLPEGGLMGVGAHEQCFIGHLAACHEIIGLTNNEMTIDHGPDIKVFLVAHRIDQSRGRLAA